MDKMMDNELKGLVLTRVIRPINTSPTGAKLAVGKTRTSKFILWNYHYIESIEDFDNELHKTYEDNSPKTTINFASGRTIVVLGDSEGIWARIKKNRNNPYDTF